MAHTFVKLGNHCSCHTLAVVSPQLESSTSPATQQGTSHTLCCPFDSSCRPNQSRQRCNHRGSQQGGDEHVQVQLPRVPHMVPLHCDSTRHDCHGSSWHVSGEDICAITRHSIRLAQQLVPVAVWCCQGNSWHVLDESWKLQ
jgi:hypothetical protein